MVMHAAHGLFVVDRRPGRATNQRIQNKGITAVLSHEKEMAGRDGRKSWWKSWWK
jgi:hypothetical protein